METLKPMPGFPDYMVSDKGHIENKHGRIIKGFLNYGARRRRQLGSTDNREAYQQVILYRDGKKRAFLIHRAVATAFLGPPPSPKHEVHHRNMNHRDHRPENLMWVDHATHVRLHLEARRSRNADGYGEF